MRIESIDQLDLQQLQYQDISRLYSTGRSESQGAGMSKTDSYRSGIMTKIGDVRLDVWIQAAQTLISRNGDEHLFEAVLAFCQDYNTHPKRNDSELADRLQYVVGGLIDNPSWVGFIRFNAKYRPEMLAKVEIVRIHPFCCDACCDIPKEQIDKSYDGRVYCPRCGKYTEFDYEDRRG